MIPSAADRWTALTYEPDRVAPCVLRGSLKVRVPDGASFRPRPVQGLTEHAVPRLHPLPPARRLRLTGWNIEALPEGCEDVVLVNCGLARGRLPASLRTLEVRRCRVPEEVILGGEGLRSVVFAKTPMKRLRVLESPNLFRLHADAGSVTVDGPEPDETRVEGTLEVGRQHTGERADLARIWRLLLHPDHGAQALALLHSRPHLAEAVGARASRDPHEGVVPDEEHLLQLAALGRVRAPNDWVHLREPLERLEDLHGLALLRITGPYRTLDLDDFPSLHTFSGHDTEVVGSPRDLRVLAARIDPALLQHVEVRELHTHFTRTPTPAQLAHLQPYYRRLGLAFPTPTRLDRVPAADQLNLTNAVVDASALRGPHELLTLMQCRVEGDELVLRQGTVHLAGCSLPRRVVFEGPNIQRINVTGGTEEIVVRGVTEVAGDLRAPRIVFEGGRPSGVHAHGEVIVRPGAS